MRIFVAMALVVFCIAGGCTSTWSNPPGSRDATLIGAFLGADARITGEIMKYGFPDTGRVRYREGYVLSYDGRNKVPVWVAERLNRERLEQSVERDAWSDFWVDEEIPEANRSRSDDYKESGYVRGRLAAASNHLGSTLSLKQSYLLSNCAPQMGEEFRQAFWIHFERRVREWALDADDLYVYTGPLYLPEQREDGRKFVTYEVIGAGDVAVPTHFFKVMVREVGKRYDVQAFLVPHKPYDGDMRLSDFLISVDELEALSGLDFFSSMGPVWQAHHEGTRPDHAWGEKESAEAEPEMEEEAGKEPAEEPKKEPEKKPEEEPMEEPAEQPAGGG